LTDFAFESFKAARVQIVTQVGNEASQELLKNVDLFWRQRLKIIVWILYLKNFRMIGFLYVSQNK